MTLQSDWVTYIGRRYRVVPLKRLFRIVNGATPSSGEESYWDGDIQWATPEDLGKLGTQILSKTRRSITQDGYRSCGTTLMPIRSIVLSTRAPIGSAAIAAAPICTNQGCKGLVPLRGVNPVFFYYILIAAKPELQSRGRGTTFTELSYDSLASFPVPLPDPDEQRAIADFLDRETAAVDALIAKKTCFIELLNEKRQALIAHTVAKGPDPKVKMRDSGEKWLGDIPAQWDVVPSNRFFVESKERAREEDEHLSATQKYGVIPLTEFERLEGRQVTHAEKNLEQRKHVEVDNFVISMRSFEGGIERVKARGCVRSSYIALVADERAHIGFFSYLFKSSAYIQGLQATAMFIRDGQDLNYNNFRQVKLPLPSFDEQRRISDFLDGEVSKSSALIAKTEGAISKLIEYRSALISAAVTGQIDVRHYHPQEAAALCQ
jgi:type I restriction enzyme S subunit